MFTVIFKISVFLYIMLLKTNSFIKPFNNKFCSIVNTPCFSRQLIKTSKTLTQLLHKIVVEIDERINPDTNNNLLLGSEDLNWTEEEVIEMAIGDPTVFAQELSSKVEAAIEEELNRQVRLTLLLFWSFNRILTNQKDGVNTVRNDRQPLMKAHLDLLTYSARQEFIKRNFTGSLLLYNRCIDYNPADGRAWLGIARIYWKIGGSRRAALAEKAYKDGLTYNPKNPYLLQAYAVMLIKLGQVKEAQKLLIVSVLGT